MSCKYCKGCSCEKNQEANKVKEAKKKAILETITELRAICQKIVGIEKESK